MLIGGDGAAAAEHGPSRHGEVPADNDTVNLLRPYLLSYWNACWSERGVQQIHSVSGSG